MRRPEDLTIGYVEKALDWPVEKWEGNCFAVASQMVKQGVVEGKAVYGAWHGLLNSRGYWKNKAGVPFVRHGWVILADGRILDPTRWSFEAVAPYIWIGRGDHEEYDRGHNRYQEEHMQPWPDSDDGERELLFELLPEVVDDLDNRGARLRDPLDPDQMDRDSLDCEHYRLTLTHKQAFWLANFPLTWFSSEHNAREVYTQIAEHGFVGFIPIDNYNAVCGELK